VVYKLSSSQARHAGENVYFASAKVSISVDSTASDGDLAVTEVFMDVATGVANCMPGPVMV
jgi:hypothetical protein